MPDRFYIFIKTAILLIVLSLTASASYDDITIVSSDKTGISFELNINDPSLYMTPVSGDTDYIAIKTVLIGLPPNAEPFITDSRFSGDIIPESMDGRRLINSPTLAEIGRIKSVRGRRVAAVSLYPYYQGGFCRTLSVSIRFEYPEGEFNGIGYVPDDKLFESVFENTILNYNQFERWPVPERIKAARTNQSPFSIAPDWYKIATHTEGLVRITGQNLALAGVSLDNLSIDSLHLFYGGGQPIPDLNSEPSPEFNEISIMVVDDGNGYFERNDYILFFAEGADRWRYPADSMPVYLENHYTNNNYYWLTVSGDFTGGGKRIPEITGEPTGSADTLITTGRFNRHIGQNKMLAIDGNGRITDYFNWYWTEQAHFTFYESIPNARTGDLADITIRAISNPGNLVFVNNYSASTVAANRPRYFYSTDHLVPGLNRFSLILDSSSIVPPYLDYLELSYIGDLIPSGEILDFSIGEFGGRGEFYIDDQFDTEPLIFDLSNSENPVFITGWTESSGEIVFSYDLMSSGSNRFYISPLSRAVSPDAVEKVSIADLRDGGPQTDMIVIAPEQFLLYLEEYESYREDKSGINILTVSLEQILNQFSYGLFDPKAIREFLKYTYENYPAPAPAAVLLVGDGVYDFENNLGFPSTNLIPPYIQVYDSSASDDNYVFFGTYGLLDSDTSYAGDRGYDMMITRWPVKTAAELITVFDKVKAYESSTTFGPWRTTITLVADDEFGNYETEWFHTSQTEELQQPPRLPASFRRNKIYLWDYPFDSIHKKPQANEAIVRSFNEGTLMINYVGHGNPDSWAHENVFNRGTDLIHLTNSDKMTLVLTASCSIGFFDAPDQEGMAEDLLRLSSGGAIGVISATRLVYSSDNAAFNKVIFDMLFGSDSLSIAQALFSAKLLRQYEGANPQPVSNDRNYAYFGDPFVKLGVPHYEVKFNEKPDSLVALGHHAIRGEIAEKTSGAHLDFDGTVDVFVYDSNIEKKHKVVNENGDSVQTVSYGLYGPVIYRGTAEVNNGFFNFSFIAPLDIGVGGKTAKISGYAFSTGSDALGLIDSIPVGLEITPSQDIAGPDIYYTFDDRADFISGDFITSGETMTLIISDSSGINLTGSLGHGITLVTDDRVENTVNLTDLFQYSAGSYVSGTIEYDMGPLSPGPHTFAVKAWDNANNSSLVEFGAEVLESGRFMVTDLMNYPNPMEESTTFSFSLTSPARRVIFEIFTLSGKKIKYVDLNSVPAGYNEFYSWDGHDADMDRVATGVYIYKVTAVSDWFSETVESFGKVVVIN